MSDDTKRKQVADQCRVVAHLATAMAEVHSDYAKMFDEDAFPSLIDGVGERTAEFMEIMGDWLSNMDAVEESDEWCDPIFAKAHEMFPVKEEPFQ